MPPKKDTAGTTAVAADSKADEGGEGIENFELPKSLVTKIAKSALPDNAKLQKDTVLSLVKGSTVFINYLAATAHDIAASRSHKTISAADVIKALEMLEFTDIAKTLQVELEMFRAANKIDKGKKAGSSTSKKGKEKEVLKVTIPAKAKSSKNALGPANEEGDGMLLDEDTAEDQPDNAIEEEEEEEDNDQEDLEPEADGDPDTGDIEADEEDGMKEEEDIDVS